MVEKRSGLGGTNGEKRIVGRGLRRIDGFIF